MARKPRNDMSETAQITADAETARRGHVGSSNVLDADSTIKEIVRRYANKLPAQSDYEASHDWHTACENIITQACYEYAESLHVPQYDSELKAADYEVKKWRDIARRLYLARGCKKNEQLRIQAEHAYMQASNAKLCGGGEQSTTEPK